MSLKYGFVGTLAILLTLLMVRGPSFAAIPDVILAPAASLYELGLFSAEGYVPDYPGANQNHLHGVIFPFILYRGHYLRADDRDGVRARIILHERVRLELSFAGSFPVDSKNNLARRGMPDLDWLGEVGPRLSVTMKKWKNQGYINLLIPFRAVFSTNFENLHHRGYTFAPGLFLDMPGVLRPTWRGIALLSSTFGDREINSYFYEVAPEFVQQDRPVYAARSGYIGSDLTLGLVIPFKERFRFFMAGQCGLHANAANGASPLFKSQTNATFITGLSWTFFKSKNRASD